MIINGYKLDKTGMLSRELSSKAFEIYSNSDYTLAEGTKDYNFKYAIFLDSTMLYGSNVMEGISEYLELEN